MELYKQMNWALLRKQKEWLLSQPESNDYATGLVMLLDNLQDDAVNNGFREEDVFGPWKSVNPAG